MLKSLCTTAVLSLAITSTCAAQRMTAQQGGAGANIGSNIGFSNSGTFMGQGANALNSDSGLSSRFQSDFNRFATRDQAFIGAAAPTGNVFSGQQMITGQMGGMSSFGGMGGMGMGGMGMGGMGMGGMGMGGMGMGGMGGGFGRGGFGGGFGNSNQFGSNQRGNTTQPTIRTRLTIDFAVPATTISQAGQRLESLIERAPQIQSTSGGVRVLMEGQTAVLQGTVASEHERQLAERLAHLEPGIAAVRNELTVTGN